jgi:hypothetical protein
MTQLQKWITLNRLYDESCPGWIRFKQSLDRNIISHMFYTLYLISPAIISLLIIFSPNFYLWLLVIYIIYLQLLIYINDRMLYLAFKANKLMDLPITKRARYLHYIRFKNECESAGIRKDKIQNLLDWHKFSNTRMFTQKFINSIKLLLSGLIALLLNHYQPQISQHISHNQPLALLFLTGLVYIIIYLLDDLFSIYKRREKKLSAFLYMYLREDSY